MNELLGILLAFVLGGCVCTVLVLWGMRIYDDIRAKLFLMQQVRDEVIHLRVMVAKQEMALKMHEETQDAVLREICAQWSEIEKDLSALKKEKEDAA